MEGNGGCGNYARFQQDGKERVRAAFYVVALLMLLAVLTGCKTSSGTGQSSENGQSSRAGNAGGGASRQSLKNLKTLGMGLNLYAEAHGESYPQMSNAASMKSALAPYVKDESAFVNPDTQEPYQPNPSLSGKSLASISAPAQIVAFYEASAAADGTRGVAFVDGHAERLPKTQWPQAKQMSGIP